MQGSKIFSGYRELERKGEIDLHGCSKNDAKRKISNDINSVLKIVDKRGSFKIITGRGKHSADQKPVLRKYVTGYLQDKFANGPYKDYKQRYECIIAVR